MGRNNSKARKKWRKDRAENLGRELTPEERLLFAIFGERPTYGLYDRPGTEANS